MSLNTCKVKNVNWEEPQKIEEYALFNQICVNVRGIGISFELIQFWDLIYWNDEKRVFGLLKIVFQRQTFAALPQHTHTHTTHLSA